MIVLLYIDADYPTRHYNNYLQSDKLLRHNHCLITCSRICCDCPILLMYASWLENDASYYPVFTPFTVEVLVFEILWYAFVILSQLVSSSLLIVLFLSSFRTPIDDSQLFCLHHTLCTRNTFDSCLSPIIFSTYLVLCCLCLSLFESILSWENMYILFVMHEPWFST